MKRLRSKLGKKGFTLMELVVVLAVMTILVGILMPNLITQKANTDRMQREKTAEVVQKALAQYYAYEGAFPKLTQSFPTVALDEGLCAELYTQLRLVTDAILPLEAGYYTYNEATGEFAYKEPA
ncbi:MAG: type II secretion system protein [Clostridiaceae bacterium]|nr:type II secretion system GspH family protein [Eubacteriales bacterium]